MALMVSNSLSNQKEEFRPLKAGKVGIYVCGPTVYDLIHVGNLRTFVSFDVIVRYLRYLGYKVTYVQNITDVDDRTIKRSNEEGITLRQLTEKYEREYFSDIKAVNNLMPDFSPRATEHIKEIIALVESLVKKGYAYAVGGDVYFSISKFADYGKLSGVKPEELKAGSRVDQDNYEKEEPADFALWKAAKPSEPSWFSPWGRGRPGWHIECSVMSAKYIGQTLDIHGGGKDLKFPHHENEIAQSESASGKKFVNYWLHTEFITINGEKMAKSLGNFITAHELLERHDPRDIRYFLVSSHYKKPVDFTEEAITSAKNSRQKLQNMLDNLRAALEDEGQKLTDKNDPGFVEQAEQTKQNFSKAMDDDFNTPEALAAMHELARLVNIYGQTEGPKSRQALQKVMDIFLELSGVLGLQFDLKEREMPEEVMKLIKEREFARKRHDFSRADKLRLELKKSGYVVEDTAAGIRWKKIK